MPAPLELWMSPLTHRIYVGRSRTDRIGRVATTKQDITKQCVNGAVMHLVAMGHTEAIVTGDEGKRFRVSITEIKE